MNNLDHAQTQMPENVREYVQLQTRLRRFELQVKEAMENDSWPLGVLADMGLITQALMMHEPNIESSTVQTLLRYYYKAFEHEKIPHEEVDLTALAYHLIQYYVNFRSALYVEASKDYLSVKEISQITKYSEYHIRELIRSGEVEGIQTPASWYGSIESLREYQAKPSKPRIFTPKKGPRIKK